MSNSYQRESIRRFPFLRARGQSGEKRGGVGAEHMVRNDYTVRITLQFLSAGRLTTKILHEIRKVRFQILIDLLTAPT